MTPPRRDTSGHRRRPRCRSDTGRPAGGQPAGRASPARRGGHGLAGQTRVARTTGRPCLVVRCPTGRVRLHPPRASDRWHRRPPEHRRTGVLRRLNGACVSAGTAGPTAGHEAEQLRVGVPSRRRLGPRHPTRGQTLANRAAHRPCPVLEKAASQDGTTPRGSRSGTPVGRTREVQQLGLVDRRAAAGWGPRHPTGTKLWPTAQLTARAQSRERSAAGRDDAAGQPIRHAGLERRVLPVSGPNSGRTRT